MNDEQITDIAREYAEEIHADTSAPFKNDVVCEEIGNAESIIRWLSQRYCLVEKTKAIKEYKSAKQDSKMAHRERQYTMLEVAIARKALLESLFPEISKEVIP